MTISGERTEQLDIFCRITGFTSDFLSFIDVELIRFFHGAIQVVVGETPFLVARITVALALSENDSAVTTDAGKDQNREVGLWGLPLKWN